MSPTRPKGRRDGQAAVLADGRLRLGVGVTIRDPTLRRSVERYLPPAAADRLRDVNNALDDRVALIRPGVCA
jgi:hypothetical protein